MIPTADQISQDYVRQMSDLGYSVFVVAISGLPDVDSETDEQVIDLCALPTSAGEMPADEYLNFALKRIGQSSRVAYDLFRQTGVSVVKGMTDDEDVIAAVQSMVDEILPPQEPVFEEGSN